MVDQAAMQSLEDLPVSLSVGYERFVLSLCKSMGVEGFGHGVVRNVEGIRKDAESMGVQLTALHLVNALMQTAMLMMQNHYPKDQVILAIRLCPRLLPYMIDDNLTVMQAADFLINENADLLIKLTGGRGLGAAID